MLFRRIPRRPLRKVRVHLIDMTESVDGVLYGRTRHELVLRAASIVHESTDSHQLAGEILIPHERVAFIQAL